MDDIQDSRKTPNQAEVDAIAQISQQRGWPLELAQQIAAAHVPIDELNSWNWMGLSPERAAAQLKWHERLSTGDLRERQATWTDNQAFSELWADSPEEIGGWESQSSVGQTHSRSSSCRKTSIFRYLHSGTICWPAAGFRAGTF